MVAAPTPATEKEAFVYDFVWSNLYATFLHELAHFIIFNNQIRIFGNEEDAADNFIVIAAEALLTDDALQTLVDSTSYYYLNLSIEADKDAEDLVTFNYPYRTGYNRFYQLNCLYFGMNPEHTSVAMQIIEFSEEDFESCEEDYEMVFGAWRRAVKFYGRDADENDQSAESYDWLYFHELNTENPMLFAMQNMLKLAIQDLNDNLTIDGYVGAGFKVCSEEEAASDAFFKSGNLGSWPPDTVTLCTQSVEALKDLAERVYENPL